MTRPLVFSLAACLAFSLTTATSALEKRAGTMPRAAPDFLQGSTVTISYYNLCSGAIWNWFGLPPFLTYGVFYDEVSEEEDFLLRTHVYYAQGAPAGYGFTSVAKVLPPFDPTCPDIGTMASAFFLPEDGWNTIEWNGDEGVLVEDFWVLVNHSGAPQNPTVIVTERGQDSPGSPGGCGLCYRPNRPTHSYIFGAETVIVCPGTPWFDSTLCDLEMIWTSEFRLGRPVSIEDMTWGKIKSLYR